LFLLISSLPE
jgi:hypothetical protein